MGIALLSKLPPPILRVEELFFVLVVTNRWRGRAIAGRGAKEGHDLKMLIPHWIDFALLIVVAGAMAVAAASAAFMLVEEWKRKQ